MPSQLFFDLLLSPDVSTFSRCHYMNASYDGMRSESKKKRSFKEKEKERFVVQECFCPVSSWFPFNKLQYLLHQLRCSKRRGTIHSDFYYFLCNRNMNFRNLKRRSKERSTERRGRKLRRLRLLLKPNAATRIGNLMSKRSRQSLKEFTNCITPELV